MSSHNSQLIWGNEEHPTLEELRQYQEDALPSAASQQVEQHILACDICTDVVEGMVLADRTSTRKAVHSINFRLHNLKHTKKKRRLPAMPLLDWRAAAAIIALLCSLALVVYYHYTQLAKDRPAAVTMTEKPAELSPATTSPAPEELREEVFAQEAAEAKAEAEAEAEAETETETAPPPAIARQEQRTKQKQKPEAAPLNTIDFESAVAPPLAEATTSSNTDSAAKQAEIASSNTNGTAANTISAEDSRLAKVADSKKIAGKVMSEDGEGLPGVTVTIKGSKTGTVTDLEGNFTLAAPAEKKTLVFNYIGYQPTETPVDSNTATVQVNLFPSVSALNEVVVVGYGTTRATTVAPSPAGGMRAFNRYIKENLRYPEAARAAYVKGKVVVAFTVTPAGQLTDVRVLKSLYPACDAEAIRLVKEGPSWQPATANGDRVAKQVKVTIRFKP